MATDRRGGEAGPSGIKSGGDGFYPSVDDGVASGRVQKSGSVAGGLVGQGREVGDRRGWCGCRERDMPKCIVGAVTGCDKSMAETDLYFGGVE